MHFNWNSEKNEKLLEERNICFEDVIVAINSGKLLSVRKNTSENHLSQDILIVEVEEYVYYVPFIKSEKEYFLKTIIPSRKLTKEFLGGKNE
ncbi:MAG: BrnT family toxin [Fusobacteriaceae bacterium]|nr:BrnT family toxin [Fusobacteriaceae bacterium]